MLYVGVFVFTGPNAHMGTSASWKSKSESELEL